MQHNLSADSAATVQAKNAAKRAQLAQHPFQRLPDLDPKARGCIAAIALASTLAACGGAEEPVKPGMTIDPVDCSASGVCR